MDNLCQGGAASFQLKFVGKMTYECYRELEDRIIDAMRRHKTLEIDLGEVSEIDLCGLHLVGLLHRAGIVVASSPAIEQAAGRLLTTQHSTALGRLSRQDGAGLHSSGELVMR